MKTFKLARLLSLLQAPAIQYSQAGDAKADAHEGLSSSSIVVSMLPLVIAVRTWKSN